MEKNELWNNQLSISFCFQIPQEVGKNNNYPTLRPLLISSSKLRLLPAPDLAALWMLYGEIG